MSVNANGINATGAINLQNLDLETALMAVQTQRASQLEAQLKDQISSVQGKNEQISKLNQLLGALNAVAAAFPSDAKAGTQIPGSASAKITDVTNAAKEAGVTVSISASSNKGDVDGLVQTVKSQIDSLSNTQQMDMLRLQSLTNKRNEAFETMTNFIKKMQDSRSSIIGNMR
jgi:hypothetical protein